MQSLSSGQDEARTRWGTHESGAAFDRKKVAYLSEQAQAFMVQRAMCVLAGIGPAHDICGLLAMGHPGFVETVDSQTCLLPLVGPANSRLICGLHQDQGQGRPSQVAVCFIDHASRERLCVQGIAEMLSTPPEKRRRVHCIEEIWIRLHVLQSFFHCPKYIRTRINGLTISHHLSPWRLEDLVGYERISAPIQTFIERSSLCFLCTVNQAGHCAINHRGGKVGFLVTSPSQGEVLLPDYEGNGAFEAIGNILETEQAALVIPDYSAQVALCISGKACVVEMPKLAAPLRQRCLGAKRAIRINVQRIGVQGGDWGIPLAYEREQSELYWARRTAARMCYM